MCSLPTSSYDFAKFSGKGFLGKSQTSRKKLLLFRNPTIYIYYLPV